ncbi:MAG: hypothetical protein HC811_11965 [Flammeovirgaceae bacterium]|nr:hypothetical protein [Flammeovirgaceae bacterium]
MDRLLSSYENNLQTIERNWQYHNLAFYYLMLGEKEKALGSLESAVKMGWLRNLSNEKIFESLRSEPRFQELTKMQTQKRKEVMALYKSHNFPEPEEF